MISLFRQTSVELPYCDLYDEVSFYPHFFNDIKQAKARFRNAAYLGGGTL